MPAVARIPRIAAAACVGTGLRGLETGVLVMVAHPSDWRGRSDVARAVRGIIVGVTGWRWKHVGRMHANVRVDSALLAAATSTWQCLL